MKATPSRFARIIGDRVFMITVAIDPDANIDNIITQINLLLVKRHGLTLSTADFAPPPQAKPALLNGISRSRLPVAAKTAL